MKSPSVSIKASFAARTNAKAIEDRMNRIIEEAKRTEEKLGLSPSLIASLVAEAFRSCVWTQPSGPRGVQNTGCGHAEGMPVSEYVFCPFCGGTIVRVAISWDHAGDPTPRPAHYKAPK